MADVGLEFVKTVRSKGKKYLYFDTGERRDGKVIYRRLPDAGALDFGTKYAAFKAIRTKRQSREVQITVDGLCRDYQLSQKFLKRAQSTQDTYVFYLRRLMKKFTDPTEGSWPVVAIERPDIRKLLEGIGPGAQIMQLSVLRTVLRYGRTNDRIPKDFDPAKDIEIDHEATPYEPWPMDLITQALANPKMRLAVGLLYYTGQRIERICTMRWSDIVDDCINVPPHKKTGELVIPIHDDLRVILAEQSRSLATILCSANGQPVSTSALRHRIQGWAKDNGIKVHPHGLRKNAVDTLFEAGCTAAMVSAITGQSLQMLEHYARRRDNRKLGKAAMAKWNEK